MSSTVGTQAGGSGQGTSRRVIYAVNSALYWAFAYTGTNVLSTWHSPDNASWTAGATHTLANAHLSEGRNLAVGYQSIGGGDVVHIGWVYKTGTNLGFATIRATISGTTLTFHTSETVLNTGMADADSLFWAGPTIELDSNQIVHIGNGWVSATGSYNGAMQEQQGSADPGLAEQMTPLGETLFTIDNSMFTETRSGYMVDTGSGSMGFIADNGSSNTTITGLEWATWPGTGGWNQGSGLGNVDVTGSITGIDRNDWGAVGRNVVGLTDVHVVYRSGSNTYVHRRWNGTSWSNGQTIPTQNSLAGGGIALCTDGRSVWLSIIDTDSANTVRTIGWTSGTFNAGGQDTWDSAWTATETSSQTRTWIGACKDVQAQLGLVYWTQGSSLVAATFSAITPDPLWFQTAQAGSSVSASTFPVAFSSSTITLGNRIIVALSIFGAGGAVISSVTDSAGNTYTKDSPAGVLSDGSEGSVWSAPIVFGAGTKPTVTAHASLACTKWAMWIHEYAVSAANTGYLDGTAANNTATVGNPATSGASSPAPHASNELAFGFFADTNVQTSITPSAGWTQRGTSLLTNSNGEGCCSDQPTVAGTGSNASFAITATGAAAVIFTIVYRVAPVPTSGPPQRRIAPPPAWLRSPQQLRQWQTWATIIRPVIAISSTGTAVSAAGESDAISSATATTSLAGQAQGPSAASASATATPALAVTAAGTSTGLSAAAATASLSIAATGSSRALATSSATLAVSTAAIGAAAASGGAAGAPTSAASAAGTSASLSGAIATASEAVALAGPVAALSTATANATTAGATALSGSSAAQATGSASLSVSVAAAGTTAAAGSSGATLGATAALAGASAGTATGAAAAALVLAASAAAAGQAGTSATLDASVVLSGASASLSSATAAATTASGTAIAGLSTAASRASATLSVALATSGGSSASTVATTTLTAAATLGGISSAASGASATLALGAAIIGSAAGQSRASAPLTVTATVAGQSASSAGLSAAPSLMATLAGTSSATSSLAAAATALSGGPIAGSSSSTSALRATLIVSVALAGAATSSAAPVATPAVLASLRGTSAALLAARATFAIPSIPVNPPTIATGSGGRTHATGSQGRDTLSGGGRATVSGAGGRDRVSGSGGRDGTRAT